MPQFKKYKRTAIAEMRPVTADDKLEYRNTGIILVNGTSVSISEADKLNGSPKIGDQIARNPQNHSDVWLVAEKYFSENFEPISEVINESYDLARRIYENELNDTYEHGL